MTRLHVSQVGLIDMDNSTVDHDGQIIRDIYEQTGLVITDLWGAVSKDKKLAKLVYEIRAVPGWWSNLPEIPRGMRFVRLAKRIGFYNHVLTKGPTRHPLAWGEKVYWSRGHFGTKTPVMVCENKGIVYGKFLFDDFPEYILQWLEHRPRGLGIMPDTQYNRTFSHPQVLRFTGKNWKQVEEALRICYARKPGEPLVLPN